MYGKYIVLFAILFTGWILRKTNFIDSKMDHGLNKLVLYFAYPCLIIYNISSLEISGQMVKDFLWTFVISLCCLYLYGVLAYGYARLRHIPRDISNVVEFSMAAPNNGFMGFPVTLLFFGEQGLLLMLAHNAALNFFLFTYGIELLRRERTDRSGITLRIIGKTALRIVTNPNIIALVIGFILIVLHIKLPGVIDEYLMYIGNIATPMAMIFIGASLVPYNFLDIVKHGINIESSLMKLIIFPLITTAIVYFLPISPLMKSIIVFGACFPTATNCPMLSEQEGQDVGTSSKILFFSTLVSIVTLPLSVLALNAIFI